MENVLYFLIFGCSAFGGRIYNGTKVDVGIARRFITAPEQGEISSGVWQIVGITNCFLNVAKLTKYKTRADERWRINFALSTNFR